MKTIKRLAAFVLAISFCFVITLSPGAHASGTPLLGGQQFGAWMAAGLYATSILLNSFNIGVPGHFNEVCQWVHEPTAVSGGTFFDYNWPDSSETISEYLNRSIIKVDQGTTTIDGVEYDDLWISPEGAQKVKANAFDFKTKWNILSNNVGTLATGDGYAGDGTPMYSTNQGIVSQTVTGVSNGTYKIPLGSVTVIRNGEFENRTNFTFYDGQTYSETGIYSGRFPQSYRAKVDGNNVTLYEKTRSGSSWSQRGPYFPYISEPFEFDYVSGIVPAEPEDIPDDYGLRLRIPHDKLETFYNTYPEYNVHNTTINIAEDEVDIDELTQAIFDMIDSLDEIKADWTKEEEPEPPVPVDPIDNIDENVQSINEYQQNMNQQVNHMHQDVEAIHMTQQQQQQIQQQMQQTQQQMQQDTSSIDNTLKDVTATPGQSDLPSFKFDLRELFPFCIPFDIYRLLSSFDATPTAPHVQLPIVIQSIGFNYTLDLDFSAWDPVAQAMRTAELIVYAIGLAWATGKVIKW